MQPFLAIPLIALVAASCGCAAYALVALARTRRALGSVPTLRAGLASAEPAGGWPAVVVVIPAHNERAVIGELVASLRGQDYPSLRVVLALDRCTDDTAVVARAAIGEEGRFEVVVIDACPDDWAGKCHAAHCGVTRSRAGAAGAPLLLFADADTLFAPGCVRAAVGLLHERGLDMLSLLSTLAHRNAHELVVQPAASLELMRHFPLDRINSDAHARSFANGQFMLFRRDAYEGVGGHASVRGELLEDLAFARSLRHAKRRVGVVLAAGLLVCRMYPSWAAFKRGWKRIYTEAAQRKPSRLRRWSAQLFATGVALPLAALASIVAGGLTRAGHPGDPLPTLCLGAGTLGLGLWLLVVGLVHRTQGAPLWTTLVHPAGALATCGLLREAAADLEGARAVEWAGRAYARPVR